MFTAPDGTVLAGIVRKHIKKICEERNIELSYNRVHHSDIEKFDAVFITGTSPGVLALNRVEDTELAGMNDIIASLMKDYNNVVNNYINTKFKQQ